MDYPNPLRLFLEFELAARAGDRARRDSAARRLRRLGFVVRWVPTRRGKARHDHRRDPHARRRQRRAGPDPRHPRDPGRPAAPAAAGRYPRLDARSHSRRGHKRAARRTRALSREEVPTFSTSFTRPIHTPPI